jgi:hypothetical protein
MPSGFRQRSRHPVLSRGLIYSALAETYLAFRRIDFAARLCRLLGLLKSRAVAGRASHFSRNFLRFFHRDQSLN